MIAPGSIESWIFVPVRSLLRSFQNPFLIFTSLCHQFTVTISSWSFLTSMVISQPACAAEKKAVHSTPSIADATGMDGGHMAIPRRRLISEYCGAGQACMDLDGKHISIAIWTIR